MSALEGFRSLWSLANATFGEGVPTGGALFDQSIQLQGLQNAVASAAPGQGWSGSSADSYADANAAHASTLGALAGLDERLAAEVDRAADVVMAGRRDLDSVRQWVNDAAASIPHTAAGERQLYPVISKGASDIAAIITRSHGDLAAIAERIRVLGGEYQALGDGGGAS